MRGQGALLHLSPWTCTLWWRGSEIDELYIIYTHMNCSYMYVYCRHGRRDCTCMCVHKYLQEADSLGRDMALVGFSTALRE